MSEPVRVRYTRADGVQTMLELTGDPFEICNAIRARLFPVEPLPENDPKFDALMAARQSTAAKAA